MKKESVLLLLALTLSTCTNMSSIEHKYQNLRYADDAEAQKLDIFIPPQPGPHPAIILVHGGGFKSGDKRSQYSLAKKLIAREYVVVCVNYRLSGEAVFPAAIHDIKAAIRFLRGNAKKYAILPDGIGIWGASAGGNLSALVGTSAGDSFLDGKIGNYQDQSTRVQACVDWFGPIDFTRMIDDAKQLGFKQSFNVDLESKYMGLDASDPANRDLVQKANPTSYIDKQDPPFYVQVGDQDPLIPYLQSERFADALLASLGKDKLVFELIKGGKHGGSKFSNTENISKIITFLDKHLKK